jgi:hypothetical protein
LARAPAAAQSEAVVTKQYEDGGVYEGTFKDGRQHGQGTYRLPNGYEYSGEWVEGEIRGQGIARFPNGSVYEGAFAAGKPEGQGKITFADGGTYEGEWARRPDHRQGVASMPTACATRAGSGTRSTTAGPDGRPQRLCLRRRLGRGRQGRQGRITYPDGAIYEGTLVRGSARGRAR